MADEFDSDDDNKAERAVSGRHAAELKALLSGESADDDVVEAKEPEEGDEEEELPSRQERRSKRNIDRATAREKLAAAEAREQVLREQLEITRRGQPERQTQQGNPVEHVDKRIKSINAQLAAVHDEWERGAGKLSAERRQQLQDKAEQLEVEKLTAVVERRDTLLEPQRQRAEHARMLRQRAPDVHDNPAALQYAQGVFQQRRARGEPDSLELYDAVMEEARQVILGKRPRPDAASKARATGMGAGARAGGVSEGPVRIAMPAGSALDRMARAAYPKDDPAVARQKWVNANGKSYLKSRSG